MQIVTDRACDLSPIQSKGLEIHYVAMRFTLDGKTYSSEELSPEAFYELLVKSDDFPTTSQPSAGEFADVYRRLAQDDPEILSIHVSSGLSGTVNAARAGAAMVPEAKITLWDTKTLSCPEAWQVEAAARALKAGWPLDRILAYLEKVSKASEGIFTLNTLKYLIHGGRISHLRGLLASVLQIKPIIAVDKEQGKYLSHAQERTERRAIHKIVDVVARKYPAGSSLRVQLLHGKHPEGLEILREAVSSRFECHWTPTVPVAPILGAHTGPTLVGLSIGPAELFREVPGIVMD